MPSISLCMITKNEEDWIAQAIRSVASIVSEVIVVDTGSTDQTVIIAQSLGATVLFQPWQDDFATPRNYGIAQARGDWILVLDADEAIAESDLPLLVEHTRDSRYCFEFMQRHYSNDQRLSNFTPVVGQYPGYERHYGGYFESNLIRLFPNGHGIQYIGRVHELVEHSIRQLKRHQVVRSTIPIHHYGHTEEVKKKKNKSLLYTPLGETKLADNPSNWQAYFELGVEHNVNGRHLESVTAFLKAIDMNPRYIPSWVNIGYVFCEMARYEDAVKSLATAIELDSQCYEAYCNLGVVYLRIGNFPTAEKYFRVAISLNPTYTNALCNLGKSLAFMGRLAESVNIFRRALDIFPQCTTAKADLGAIYFNEKKYDEAEKYLKMALADNPNNAEVNHNLAQLYRVTKTTHAPAFAAEVPLMFSGPDLIGSEAAGNSGQQVAAPGFQIVLGETDRSSDLGQKA